MTPALISQRNNCRNCYKCIRHCPVKSIRFSGNQASVMEDECILCGNCFTICPQGAKAIRNDTNAAKTLIAENDLVAVSVAPSFAAYYPGYGIASLEKALKRLGFSLVGETALGAALVAKEYDALLEARDGKPLISSCCPTVNLLIQKHCPEALPFLDHVMTPVEAHCSVIKRQNPNAKTVFIGPCISKKSEAGQGSGLIDLALTFGDLERWMREEEIELEPVPDPDIRGGRSRLFPTTGGIIRTMAKPAPYQYLAVDGIDNCINAIRDLAEGHLEGCFIEMSACAGSCVGGPLMVQKARTPVRGVMAVNSYAGNTDYPIPETGEGLDRDYPYLGKGRKQPDPEEIQDILHRMGKNSPEDELNCGGCGYDTCREKAAAVFQGKANYAMCLPFLKEKAESFSDNIINNTPNSIIVLDETLEVQQINRAAMKMMNITHADHVMGEPVVRILDPSPFLGVLDSGAGIPERKAYLAEYGKYVEQTILYDREYHILICLMRDITEEERTREKREVISRKTIETADQVVEKQMRIVQEITSLLGETAAETKIALTQLKESFIDE